MILSDADRASLDSHRVAHLATADAAGVPHVIPVCYALVGDAVYFVIDEKPKRSRTRLKRLRNIAENARVALVVDDYDEDWSRLAYLLVRGAAVLVEDRSEYDLVLQALRARYAPYRGMALAFDTHPMVRITPEHVHTWRAAEHAATR